VRVTVVKNEDGKQELGFEYPAGPAEPKPELVVAEGGKAPAKKARVAKPKPPEREPDTPLGAG
jgi:ATP-dependent Clp protease ATP-binding subunit ClpA